MFSPSHRQRHSFVLQLVQFFLNLFCLCSFYSRIYDTVSYQLESNQVNQIRHEDGDGHHLSSSQQPKIRYISPFRLPYIEYHRKRSDKLCIIPNCWPFDSFSIVSEQTLQARLHISKNESDIVWLAISDKLKWPHRYENWYKTILNSTQNKNKVYHKANLNNNIKLQVFRTRYTGRNFFRNISCLSRSVLKC
jgi:hypothetical protein